MINKKLHYIWFGGKPKSKLTEICINSWRRKCLDYEIIEWNEDNVDLIKLCKECTFLKKCVELKLWAFVSDFLRLYVLFNEGGIYLDTDVEIVQPFNEEILSNDMFIGLENNYYVGTSVIGAKKGNVVIKRLLGFYYDEIWKVSYFNNPIIFKNVFEREPELSKKCRIYSQDYFSPYVPNERNNCLVDKNNTYCIHWYTADWNMSKKGYVFLNTKHLRPGVKKILVTIRKNIGYIKKVYLK